MAIATASITGDSAISASSADDLVEQPFHHDVPIGDRAVENVEHRHVADIGIGAGTEPQLVGVRGEPDIDRQHPELFQHLQDAAFRRDRQREDHEIDAGLAGEFDEIVDGAELGHAFAHRRRALVAAIVEGADNVHVGIALAGHRRDQRFAARAGADNDGAAVETALPSPVPHQEKQRAAKREQRDQPDRRNSCRARRGRIDRRLWRRTTRQSASRNTTDHADASRIYCFSWPRNA